MKGGKGGGSGAGENGSKRRNDCFVGKEAKLTLLVLKILEAESIKENKNKVLVFLRIGKSVLREGRVGVMTVKQLKNRRGEIGKTIILVTRKNNFCFSLGDNL